MLSGACSIHDDWPCSTADEPAPRCKIFGPTPGPTTSIADPNRARQRGGRSPQTAEKRGGRDQIFRLTSPRRKGPPRHRLTPRHWALLVPPVAAQLLRTGCTGAKVDTPFRTPRPRPAPHRSRPTNGCPVGPRSRVPDGDDLACPNGPSLDHRFASIGVGSKGRRTMPWGRGPHGSLVRRHRPPERIAAGSRSRTQIATGRGSPSSEVALRAHRQGIAFATSEGTRLLRGDAAGAGPRTRADRLLEAGSTAAERRPGWIIAVSSPRGHPNADSGIPRTSSLGSRRMASGSCPRWWTTSRSSPGTSLPAKRRSPWASLSRCRTAKTSPRAHGTIHDDNIRWNHSDAAVLLPDESGVVRLPIAEGRRHDRKSDRADDHRPTRAPPSAGDSSRRA